MIKSILIMVFCLLPGFYNICLPQVNVGWFRTYSAGWGKNFVNDFEIDALGNSYLTGNVSKNAMNSRTAIGTVKYGLNGDLLWAKNFEGSNQTLAEGMALVVHKKGNVFVTGTCTDVDSSENFCTIKYNSIGEILWTKKFHSGPGGRDKAVAIAFDEDNNVYVTGFTYYYGSPYYYFWNTIKYDSSGNQIWLTRYEGDLYKLKGSISITLDNYQNVYISGYTTEVSNSVDFCTIKYNQTGQQQWVSFFNNPNFKDVASDISIDNVGNVYILGKSFLNDNFFYTTLVKYDNNGNEIWHVMTDSAGWNGSHYYNKISFKLDSENNIYIATTYKYNCCTIKYNSNGEQEWISKFNKDSEYVYSKGIGINIDRYGNIYTTGLARIFANVESFITIKYNSEGTILWEKSFYIYNSREYDEGAFIGFDKSNNIYIAGIHTNSDYHIKYSLLKYSQPIGIHEINAGIPSQYKLHQNYPNPFNPKTIISYEIPVDDFITLKIYNIEGKEINTLVNEKQNVGKYEVDFDGSDLPSGVYFYKISANNFTGTKRMLLLK